MDGRRGGDGRPELVAVLPEEAYMAAVAERVGLVPLPRTGRFSALVVVGPQAQRESVSRTLRALGVREVVQAASVEEARRRAAALGGPAMCVADVSLPDGSGIALLRDLRALGWQRGVVLSHLEDLYAVRAALAAGVRCLLGAWAARPPR